MSDGNGEGKEAESKILNPIPIPILSRHCEGDFAFYLFSPDYHTLVVSVSVSDSCPITD